MQTIPPASLLRKFAALAVCALAGFGASMARAGQGGAENYDVVVYGGVSGGVAAAVQAARMGKTVVLIAPGKHLGGMTSGGLGWVDVGNVASIGGIAREYFHNVWKHYQDDASWKWEQKHPMQGQHGPLPPGDETLWIVEPSVAEGLFDRMAAEAKIPVVRQERLNRKDGVVKKGGRIVSIAMESGRVFRGKMFIDATYEGDLMAAAGVSYTVGREANSLYGETINGVGSLFRPAKYPEGIDPYLVKGDPSSGLLPRVKPYYGGKEGEGDRGVQAYNYRMCLTNDPRNSVAIGKPEGYDEREYEILFRAIEIGSKEFMRPDRIPNRKTDTNNNGYISTDYVGMSAEYPEADYATRERIAKAHERWQRGLLWTLQNHPRVPEEIRANYAQWGLAKDEFVDNGNWPHQLYIREARRMVSDYVVTENIALGKQAVEDPVGLGSYAMDSHAIQHAISPKGFVKNEGGMFVKLPAPYGISYRAIVPKKGECENLLVPVCVSATHAAYGSARMEPVFMVLGQSAATAACLAIEGGLPVQAVPYAGLHERLLADKQIVDWPKAGEK